MWFPLAVYFSLSENTIQRIYICVQNNDALFVEISTREINRSSWYDVGAGGKLNYS